MSILRHIFGLISVGFDILDEAGKASSAPRDAVAEAESEKKTAKSRDNKDRIYKLDYRARDLVNTSISDRDQVKIEKLKLACYLYGGVCGLREIETEKSYERREGPISDLSTCNYYLGEDGTRGQYEKGRKDIHEGNYDNFRLNRITEVRFIQTFMNRGMPFENDMILDTAWDDMWNENFRGNNFPGW